MQIALNQATFRRLVQLQLLCAAITVGVFLLQLYSWARFDADFDALVMKHFGPVPLQDWVWGAIAVFAIAIGILMVASMIGLLWFKRWARVGYWASMPAIFILFIVSFGFVPTYDSAIDDLLAVIDSALFGAILLLSYAKGLGAEWFARSPKSFEE